ncbi:MAG: Na/Pi cotransporter family protein [Gammaproteobacteria bacterium]|nr:Na/Pi cotransporter family protein [Gammaproteobacteria bacterium]
MLRQILLPIIFAILGWGFWISPEFKTIAAGVAIFLFGMLSLENGFKVFTGGILEKILKKFTNTRFKSISFGILSTSILQSSSLVSIITISFLSAGLIGLSEGIGIIFGANLGTTTGAWLIAGFGLKVKISAYALPMLVFGTVLIFQNSKTLKGVGYILAGLGFLFLGIHYMKEGFETFKDTLDLTQFSVDGLKGLFVYTLIGIAATVIMQSSHATLVITITALSLAQISYENALALAIGANVGTTITAMIGALSSNHQGKRLAGAHLIFNLVTGFSAILLLKPLLLLVDEISIFSGIAADDFTLKLAVFHTLFNLLGILIMLPLMDKLARFLESFIPSKTVGRKKARFLNDSTLAYADTATEAVKNETLHMWENTVDLIAHGIRVPTKALLTTEEPVKNLIDKHAFKGEFDLDHFYELKIKGLYSDIISYVSKAEFSWDLEQSGEIHWLRKANQNMVESIKDIKHLQKNLMRYCVDPNAVIAEQYNHIRWQIAELIHMLNKINHATEDDIPSLMIDEIKLDLEHALQSQNLRIDEMIRKRQITAEMGISLMNDKSYVANISQKMVNIAETLFIKHSKKLSEIEKNIQLDESDLTEIQQRHQTDVGSN